MYNQKHFLTLLFLLVSCCLFANSTNSMMTVDLELFQSDTQTPAIYSSTTTTFVLTNNGQNTATGVVVSFSKNQINITGQPTVSAGTSQAHWTANPYWEIPSLDAGQSATIELPVFTLSDNPLLFAEVTAQNEGDVDSTPNNGNGTSANEDDEATFPAGTTTGGGYPDLVVNDFYVNETVVFGDIFGFNATIANIGTGTADGSFSFSFYISDDEIFDANDTRISGFPTGNFAPGFSASASNGGPFPFLPAGNYYALGVVDNNDEISESNENNNVFSRPITILPFVSGPDLVISNFQIPGSGATNSIVDYTIDIANNGNAFAGEFKVGFFLSTDNNLSSDDISVGEIPTANFGPQFSVDNVTGQINLNGVAAGSYFLIAKVDSDDQEEEVDEQNNFIVKNFTVTGGNSGGMGADLELSMTADNANPNIYTTTRLTLTVVNNGPEGTENVHINIPKSSEWVVAGDGNITTNMQATVDPAGASKITWYIPTLGNGQSATMSIDIFTLSDNANPCAEVVQSSQQDPDSTPNNGNCPQVNEDDEANLQGGSSPTLTVDYSFGNSPFLPTQALTDIETTIEVRVNRSGTNMASLPYVVDAYVSQDDQWSPDDIFIGRNDEAELNNFSNRIKFITGTIDQPIEGNYYLILVADPDNIVNETNENNNIFTSALEVFVSEYDGCTYELQADEILTAASNINTTTLIARIGSQVLRYAISDEGQVQNSSIIGDFVEDSILIVNNILQYKAANGIIAAQKPLSQALLDIIPDLHQAGISPAGYIFAGVSGNSLVAVTTDLQTNPIETIVLETDIQPNSQQNPRTQIIKIDKRINGNDNPIIIYKYDNTPTAGLPNLKAVELLVGGGINEIISAESVLTHRIITFPFNTIKISYSTSNVGQFGGTTTNKIIGLSRENLSIVYETTRSVTTFANGSINNASISANSSPFYPLNFSTSFYENNFGPGFIYAPIVTVNVPNGDNFFFPTDQSFPIQNPYQYSSTVAISQTNNNAFFFSNPVNGTTTVYAYKCGNTSNPDGTDVALSLSVDNTASGLWSNINYTLTATNNGDEAATGLVIDFDNGSQDANKKLAYVGSNDPDYDSWNGLWNVGTLAPGESKMVTVELFVLQPAAPSTTLTAFVSSLNETDSNANNDQASATITIPNTATLQEQSVNATRQISQPKLLQIAPNPASDQIRLVVEAPAIATSSEIFILDSYGKQIATKFIQFTEGYNFIDFDVSEYPAGMYHLFLPDGGKGKRVMRFVKVE